MVKKLELYIKLDLYRSKTVREYPYEDLGFTLTVWEDLEGNPVSELYSKFCFVFKK